MHIDKEEFDVKCKEVISDVNNQKITSPVWGWMAFGAMAGFFLSCFKSKKKIKDPILNTGSFKKDKV